MGRTYGTQVYSLCFTRSLSFALAQDFTPGYKMGRAYGTRIYSCISLNSKTPFLRCVICRPDYIILIIIPM